MKIVISVLPEKSFISINPNIKFLNPNTIIPTIIKTIVKPNVANIYLPMDIFSLFNNFITI